MGDERKDAPGWTAPGTGRGRAIATALARLDRSRRVAEQSVTLGVADIRLLWMFTDGRPRTLRQIAETLGLEQSTVNRQVNGALAEGILRRYREPGRSAWLVEATDAGMRTFEADVASSFGAYERALADLGEDADRFVELLERYGRSFGEAAHAMADEPGGEEG